LASKVKHGGLALNLMEARFKGAYLDQQNVIRQRFSPGYRIGAPATLVRSVQGLTTVRFYQTFTGGSWGNSILIPRKARLAILDPRSWYTDRLYLITGAIYYKWMAVGNVGTLGGPNGPQYRSGPFIDQDFDKGGQIGFAANNPGDVWWHRKGERWQR
jgi:hypothetical protein